MMNRVDQLVQVFVADEVVEDDVAQADEEKNCQGIEQRSADYQIHRAQFYAMRSDKVKPRFPLRPADHNQIKGK